MITESPYQFRSKLLFSQLQADTFILGSHCFDTSSQMNPNLLTFLCYFFLYFSIMVELGA